MRWLAIICGIAAAVSVVAYLFVDQTRPDLPPLLPHSRKVAPVDGGQSRHWWLNARDLLVLNPPNATRPGFNRIPLDKGEGTRLTAISTLFAASAGVADSVRISPTGKWVLWTARDNSIHVATVDGSKHYRVPQTGPTYNVWNNDESGWYVLKPANDIIDHVERHDLSAPMKTARWAPLAQPIPHDPRHVMMDCIGITDDSKFVVALLQYNARLGFLADFGVIPLVANPATVNHIQLQAPYVARTGDLTTAVGAYKVVWRLDIVLPRPQTLHDLGLQGSPQPSVGLWVVDRQTNQTVPLGYVDVLSHNPGDGPHDIRIAPDGSRVSFIYRNAIYTVPAT